jgi:hypothetical protein
MPFENDEIRMKNGAPGKCRPDRHSSFSPLSWTATSRFDALCLLKALSLSKGTSPGRLADFVITSTYTR